MNLIKCRAIIATGLCILGGLFSSSVHAAVQIDLVVDYSNPTDPVLSVISNSKQCKGMGQGCIDIARYSKPNIRFNLEDACESGGPEYKLTGIRIGMVEKVWPTNTNPLPAVVATDFSADINTGVVDLTAGKNKLADDRIKFKNRNSHAYTVFYEISAKHCTDTTKPDIYLDPRIRNTGGKQ